MVRVFGCKSQEALWMLRREHVYWFYCGNRHQQNVLGMQAQAIGHPIPENLSLFTCAFSSPGSRQTCLTLTLHRMTCCKTACTYLRIRPSSQLDSLSG